MKAGSRRQLAIYGVLLAAAAAAIVFGLNEIYGFLNSSSTASGTQLTATVERGTVQASVSASGNVGVASSANASFATSGTLTAIDVTVGQHVKAGQIVARIDPTSAETTLQSAEANLEQAQSTLQTAQSGLTAAQKASNASSLQQGQLSVTSDEQQLAADRTTLATAETQLASDRNLDCPPSSSSTANTANSSSGAAQSSNTGSSGSSGSSSSGTSASGASASSGSGASSTGSGTSSASSSSSGGGSTGSGGGGSLSSSHKGVAEITASGDPTGSGAASTGATGSAAAASAAATTTAAPASSATTGQVSTIGPTSATFSGDVDPDGLAATYWFEYGTSATSLSSTTAKYDAGAGSAPVPVSIEVAGLEPNRNYLVELVVSSSSGSAEGGLSLFRTAGTTQSATTGSATSVGSTTVTLSGSVSPSGLDTKYWFQYGTSATRLGASTARLDAGSGSQSIPVTASVSGLKGAITYYFRLVTRNASGTSAGAEATFTTSAAVEPTVATGSASSVMTSAATLGGSIDPNGSDTKYWFVYGTTSAYGKRTPTLDAGSGTSSAQVSASVSGLKTNTEYLFKLVAENAFGTVSGIGEVTRTAESSCTTDAQTVVDDAQTVQHAAATLTTAKESLVQTEATISSSETPSASAIASDDATVSQDEATVASDRKALTETTLTAPIAGMVTAVNDSVGESVSGGGSSVSGAAASAGSSSSSTGSSSFTGGSSGSGASSSSASASGVVTIESLSRLEIVAGFAEADATKIAVGEPATITFPALPESEVAGKVVAVSSTSTVVSNVVTYSETIALVNPPSEVKEGMTADVAVIDQTRANVLELPSSAITTTGTVSTVELLQNGKQTLTRVTTGVVGNSTTQIVSGLSAGQIVAEPTVSIQTSTTSSSTGTGGLGGLGGLGGGGGFGGGGGGGFTRGG